MGFFPWSPLGRGVERAVPDRHAARVAGRDRSLRLVRRALPRAAVPRVVEAVVRAADGLELTPCRWPCSGYEMLPESPHHYWEPEPPDSLRRRSPLKIKLCRLK